MVKTGIILTGSTGYLGSKLIRRLKSNEVLTVRRNSISGREIVFYDLLGNLIEKKQIKFDEYTVIHLATFFSKDNTQKEIINSSNIDFGINLLENTKKFNIKKIIYTNTMFNFYKETNIRNLEYTKSKMAFSETLKEFTEANKIKLDQVYIDNTFGGLDARKKIIPLIVESIKNRTGNPIKEKERFINLIYFEDVITRIIKSINTEITGDSCFVNNKSVNISSIYEYFESVIINNNFEKNLLYGENEYMKNSPQINHHEVNLSRIDKYLLKLFK